jgi:hypothetical protein
VQKEEKAPANTVAAFLRQSGEGMLGRLPVEMAVLLGADPSQSGSKVLAEAVQEYNIIVGCDRRQ